MAEEPFDIKTNLGAVIADLKAISPKLATGSRKAMHHAAAVIIDKQREILRDEPVGGVVTKTTYTLNTASRRGGYRRGPRARELGGARIASIESSSSARGYHTGLRDAVAANLKTSVTTPKTGRGASVRVQTKSPMWSNKALNSKKWRHPVFGPNGSMPQVEQAGNQYFQRGVAGGIVAAREALDVVVADVLATIKDHPTT